MALAKKLAQTEFQSVSRRERFPALNENDELPPSCAIEDTYSIAASPHQSALLCRSALVGLLSVSFLLDFTLGLANHETQASTTLRRLHDGQVLQQCKSHRGNRRSECAITQN